MNPYIGIVHRDAGSAYGVTFPDAPGCFSAADTLDDLFDQAEEALGLWLDVALEGGASVQPPRGLSALRDDADWAGSFADAALVIAVPSPRLGLPAAA